MTPRVQGTDTDGRPAITDHFSRWLGGYLGISKSSELKGIDDQATD